MTIDQFKQIKTLELVAIDFAGNEATKQIDIAPQWLAQAGIAFGWANRPMGWICNGYEGLCD